MRSSHNKQFKLYLQFLIFLVFLGCKTSYQAGKMQSQSISVVKKTTDSSFSLIDQFLKPYQERMSDSFSIVIAQIEEKLVKKTPAGSLGNMVVNAMHSYITTSWSKQDVQIPPVTIILMNPGGIRLKEIEPGPFTLESLFKLLPFENTLVNLSISGPDLSTLLAGTNSAGGWPMKLITPTSVQINSLVDLEKIPVINLVTNDYLAQGGDGCSILKTLPHEDSRILLRDIVKNYLIKQKKIGADNEIRILKDK